MKKIFILFLISIFTMLYAKEYIVKDFKPKIKIKKLGLGSERDEFRLTEENLKKIDSDQQAQILINNMLRIFFKKHTFLGYKSIILINEQINVEFIKRYNFLNITTLREGGIGSIPALNFAISRKKNRLFRFGRAELEPGTLFGEIRKNDLKSFNKIIKEEKIKVFNAELALNICLLFIKLAFSKDIDIIFDEVQIYNNFKKIWGEEESKQELGKLKSLIKPPNVLSEKRRFEITFLTLNSLSIYKWRFYIFKNGCIKLLMLKKVHI